MNILQKVKSLPRNRFFLYYFISPMIFSILLAEFEWFITYFHSRFNSPNIFFFVLFYFAIFFCYRVFIRTSISIIIKGKRKFIFSDNNDLAIAIGIFIPVYINQKFKLNFHLKMSFLDAILVFLFFLFTITLALGAMRIFALLSKRILTVFHILMISLLVVILVIYAHHSRGRENTKQILLVSIDSLRPDHLSLYGYEKIHTKNIDILAKNSYVFLNAYCQAPYTAASLASIATGCFPFNTKIRNFGMDIDSSIKTLGEILSEYNFDNVVVGAQDISYNRFARGFRKIDDALIPFADYQYYKLLNFMNRRKVKERTIWAASYVKHNIAKNYVLWIHYWDPHAPYQPPKAYLRKESNIKIDGTVKELLDFMDGKKAYSDEDLKNIIELYDSEIQFVDDNLKRLFKYFLNRNLNYIYVITADHGEALGENELFLHSTDLIEAMIKVPLILKCSWLETAGKKIPEVVSTIDILPTLLDLLDIEGKNLDYDGRSLLPMLTAKAKDYTEFAYFESLGAEKVGLRYNNHKMVYDVKNKRKEFYILDSRGIAKEVSPIPSISKSLENFFLQLLDVAYFNELKIYKPKVDPQSEKNLKALGYIK